MANIVLYLHNPTPQVLIEDQFNQSIGGEPEIGLDDQVLTLKSLDDDITVISGDLPELLSQIIDACEVKGIKPAARTVIDDDQRNVLLETTSRWLEHLDQTVIPALEDPEDIEAYTTHRREVEAVSAQLDPRNREDPRDSA